jgi:hypothetical protein
MLKGGARSPARISAATNGTLMLELRTVGLGVARQVFFSREVPAAARGTALEPLDGPRGG